MELRSLMAGAVQVGLIILQPLFDLFHGGLLSGSLGSFDSLPGRGDRFLGMIGVACDSLKLT